MKIIIPQSSGFKDIPILKILRKHSEELITTRIISKIINYNPLQPAGGVTSDITL